MTAPLLVLAWGNPSRGDDALGPLLGERLEALLAACPDLASRCEVQQDFQLQVEDASDIAGRDLVIFVDAAVDAPPPFSFAAIGPQADASVSTHALSPGAVLDVACKIFGESPLAYMLAVRGEDFSLGVPLSAAGAAHLDAAWSLLMRIVEADDPLTEARRSLAQR